MLQESHNVSPPVTLARTVDKAVTTDKETRERQRPAAILREAFIRKKV